MPGFDHALDLAVLVLGEEPPHVLHLLLSITLLNDLNANVPVKVAIWSHGLAGDGLIRLADLVELLELLLILPNLIGVESSGKLAVGPPNFEGGGDGVKPKAVVGPSDLINLIVLFHLPTLPNSLGNLELLLLPCKLCEPRSPNGLQELVLVLFNQAVAVCLQPLSVLMKLITAYRHAPHNLDSPCTPRVITLECNRTILLFGDAVLVHPLAKLLHDLNTPKFRNLICYHLLLLFPVCWRGLEGVPQINILTRRLEL
mmetsp:Transcript_6646/g.13326  ORF Transcript_6646/g.13326 Transcript_6646/m.13326 type:complete len:257 (+) Transcript_6646:1403-2173(+)